MAKLKIGVFGGYRGKTMINVLLQHPDAELVAVCDKYEPILEEIQKSAEEVGTKVATYTSFDEFIEHDMDAVVLANYATEHATFAVRCLNKGLHVMSEVLPCETMAQAVELVEAVERTGKVYTYAENYCYMRHTFEMWRRFRTGEIGDVVYMDGEYIHDCAMVWPLITYGDPTHWRNRLTPNFYCTHSLGPLLTITGQRPMQVVGFETPLSERYKETAITRGGGIELVTFENGAVARSIHGDLKREPCSMSYQIYGQRGMMETERFSDMEGREAILHIYKESDRPGHGNWEHYMPEPFIDADMARKFGTHGGSDFYATHFFIEKILGRPQGEWAIDVYQALDMGICGLLAYKSALNGNIPMKVPNFRNPEEREAYRNDNACTDPKIAGDQLQPVSTHKFEPVPAETYARHKKFWENGSHLEYGKETELKD